MLFLTELDFFLHFFFLKGAGWQFWFGFFLSLIGSCLPPDMEIGHIQNDIENLLCRIWCWCFSGCDVNACMANGGRFKVEFLKWIQIVKGDDISFRWSKILLAFVSIGSKTVGWFLMKSNVEWFNDMTNVVLLLPRCCSIIFGCQFDLGLVKLSQWLRHYQNI